MNEQELTALLIENVSLQLRHPHYVRTVETRNFSRMMTTGEGQDSEVHRYRRFEDEELKEQRSRLYNSQTEGLISSLRKHWKRMQRIESVRETIEGPNETAIKALRESYYNFIPGESLNDWLNRTLEYLGVTDPNAWIVYERTDRRNEENRVLDVKTWPFIVPSIDALNFEYLYGELQWFICRTSTLERVVESGRITTKVLETYFLYAPGGIVRLREIGQKTTPETGETVVDIDVYIAPEMTDVSHMDTTVMIYTGGNKRRHFYLKTIQNGTTEVPALIAGAYLDEITGQETCVPWFQPGKGQLDDIIKLKSSLDVILTVHTYPRRWEFVKPCRFSDPAQGECVGGYLNGDHGHICPACGGSGKAPNFTTEQEVLQLILPDSPEMILELPKLAFTEPIDTTLPELLQKLIDRREVQFVNAIFSSDPHQKPDGAGDMTAFEVAKINDGVHDALITYGRHYSRHWELAVRVGAQYREVEVTNVDHSFPEDLEIDTLDELLFRFGQAKEKGVGFEVIAALRRRIQQKVFEASPTKQKTIAARYEWLPFDDKSEQEVAMILAGRSPLDSARVLRENWLEVFREIEQENPLFADMAYPKQREIVGAKVDEFKTRIELIDEPQGPELTPAMDEETDDEQETGSAE